MIIIVVEPAHHKAAACELVGAKTGCNFQFIFLSHSAYITFRVIMSLRKPCHMPFRKLIPPFTLTALFFMAGLFIRFLVKNAPLVGIPISDSIGFEHEL